MVYHLIRYTLRHKSALKYIAPYWSISLIECKVHNLAFLVDALFLGVFAITFELHQAKRGLMVIFKNFVRYISAFDYYGGLYDFALIPLKIKYYSILQKLLSRMLYISNCEVIYYVIYVICSHYIGKAISPLFAWPSSFITWKNCQRCYIHHKFELFHYNKQYGPYVKSGYWALIGNPRPNEVYMLSEQRICVILKLLQIYKNDQKSNLCWHVCNWRHT